MGHLAGHTSAAGGQGCSRIADPPSLLDWYFVDRTLITSTRYFPKIENYGTSLAQIVTSEPVGPWKDIMQGLAISISSAKKYFYIQTPYFLPTEAVLVAMQTAALSGVDVRLMLPMRADNRLTHLLLLLSGRCALFGSQGLFL